MAITPKIVAGCSYNQRTDEGKFTRIFIFGTPNSVTTRVLIQMMGRVRYLHTNEVHFYIRMKRENRCKTLRETMDLIKRNGEALYTATMRALDDAMLAGDKRVVLERIENWQASHSLLMDIVYPHNRLEEELNRGDYFEEAIKACIRNGYSWEMNPPQFLSEEEVKERKQQVKEEKQHVLVEHRQDYDKLRVLSVDEQEQLDFTSRRKTVQQKAELLKSYVCESFDAKDEDEQFEIFQTLQDKHKRRKVSLNHQMLQGKTPLDMAQDRHHGRFYSEGNEFHPPQPVFYNQMTRLIRCLGLTSLVDFETCFDSQIFLEDLIRYKEFIQLLQETYNLHARSKTETDWNDLSLPRVMQKVSALVRAESGNALKKYCVECKKFKCGHLTNGKRSQKQGVKTRAFVYRLCPGDLCRMAQKIKTSE